MLVKFWKENRLDGEFSLTGDQIAERFAEWANEFGVENIKQMRFERCVLNFVSDAKGLNATFEARDYEAIVKNCWESFLSMEEN